MKISIHKRVDAPGIINYDIKFSDGRDPLTIFYESDSPGFSGNKHDDAILFSTIHLAMRNARQVHLHGTATQKSLLNLIEYQKAWTRWKPEKYSEVKITADTVIKGSCETDRAVSAYSGGVDALFSLFKNIPEGNPENITYNLGACLLVHGFDISLSDRTAFEVVRDRASVLHSSLGLESLWIRTNSKETTGDWEDSFASQLMACLHLFSDRFGIALIGSSEPYDELIIPWGSSPITDHLLSGGFMEAVHYGAGFSRTEKIEYLSKFPLAVENLRVCWEGSDKTRNCGVCEKCMRTRLNFEAAGVRNPPCFLQPFDPKIASTIRIKNDAQRRELESIVKFSRKKGNDSQWVANLEAKVRSRPFPGRNILRALVRKTGLRPMLRTLRGSSPFRR